MNTEIQYLENTFHTKLQQPIEDKQIFFEYLHLSPLKVTHRSMPIIWFLFRRYTWVWLYPARDLWMIYSIHLRLLAIFYKHWISLKFKMLFWEYVSMKNSLNDVHKRNYSKMFSNIIKCKRSSKFMCWYSVWIFSEIHWKFFEVLLKASNRYFMNRYRFVFMFGRRN